MAKKTDKKASRVVKTPTKEGKVTKTEVKKAVKAVKKTKELESAPKSPLVGIKPTTKKPTLVESVDVVLKDNKLVTKPHVSVPLNMFFVPKATLVRFRPREQRTGRYSFDTTKKFVVLFEIDQIANHLILVEVGSGKIVTMVHSEDLEIVPVDEA